MMWLAIGEANPERSLSFFACKLLTLRLTNFADRNERQHGQDNKSYHHRGTPWSDRSECRPAAKAFRAHIVLIGLEV
jgi:hypothetical protein